MPNEEVEYKYKTLRLAVEAMRNEQRSFFRTRNTATLSKCKALEQRVDKLLEEK